MNNNPQAVTLDVEDILIRAREIFRLEIIAAQKVAQRLDKPFADTVQAILHASGKVVLVGVGKSGLIAQKSRARCAA